MQEFDKIFLSWRTGQGKARHIVGVLEKKPSGSYTFTYDSKVVEEAKKDGFIAYTEFADFNQTYNGSVLDIFAQRLTKSERSDVKNFYDFWEIEPTHIQDKFYLLGHTQGLLPTDNFEFLAEYRPVEGLHFLTDLAHITERKHKSGTVFVGDTLRYEHDKENVHDSYAVKVFKENVEIGFIKKIHSRVFLSSDKQLKLAVKAVDQNGSIKRIFVKVSI